MSKQKIAFLDRDGVINKKQPGGAYVTSVELFEFNPGIFEVLRRLSADGYELVVVTNQRGIARGLMTEGELAKIHDYMKEGLRKESISMLDIFFCPHNFDECSCRKPKTGMLEAAAKKYDIDLAESILISDSSDDVDMGKKFGIGKNILIKTDRPEHFYKHHWLEGDYR